MDRDTAEAIAWLFQMAKGHYAPAKPSAQKPHRNNRHRLKRTRTKRAQRTASK